MNEKRIFIWNTLASIISSSLSAVLLLIINRTYGGEAGGIFSIAFASATILNAIGDHNVRIYQVTDIKKKYSFRIYLYARYILTLMMIISSIVFIFVNGYDNTKALILISIIIYRCVDDISDVYQGELQINNRLEIASKSVIYRNVLSILLFSAITLLTYNFLFSMIALAITNLAIFYIYDVNLCGVKKDSNKFGRTELNITLTLLKNCMPLMISTFLNLYIINAPKYAIDTYLDYQLQNVFSIIYLPTFSINLFCLFIFKPILNRLASYWDYRDLHAFKKIVAIMTFIIISMTVFILIMCNIIGIQVLSFIYGILLEEYHIELLILILSGGFMALSIMLFNILTTMRSHGYLIIAYGITALTALLVSDICVKTYSLLGASFSSLIISVVLFCSLLIFLLLEYKKKKSIVKILS